MLRIDGLFLSGLVKASSSHRLGDRGLHHDRRAEDVASVQLVNGLVCDPLVHEVDEGVASSLDQDGTTWKSTVSEELPQICLFDIQRKVSNVQFTHFELFW